MTVRAYFQSFARELKAQFAEQRIGEWKIVEVEDDLEDAPDFDEKQEQGP